MDKRPIEVLESLGPLLALAFGQCDEIMARSADLITIA
jgi:hypothetical protein